MLMQPYSLDDVNALLLGRPPFLPFALAASVLDLDLALPPLFPSLEKWALMICLGVIVLPLRCEVGMVFARRICAVNFGVVTRLKAALHPLKSVSPQGLRFFVVPNAFDQLMEAVALPVKTIRGVNGNFKPRTLAAAFNLCAQLLRELEHLLLVCHHVSFRDQQGHYNPSGLGCQIEWVDFEGKALTLLNESARKNIYFRDLEVKGK